MDHARHDHAEQSAWSGDDTRDFDPDPECAHCGRPFLRYELDPDGLCVSCAAFSMDAADYAASDADAYNDRQRDE